MGKINYKEVGLKVGLEIHRQIESHKLFCNCASELSDKKPDFVIKRFLHDVSSEMSEKDIVAEYEKAKKRYALYEVMDESCCEVETDEEPIHAINRDALDAVLEVALLLNCKIINPIQIMRKQVLDYSNTSGFQRTALVALDGYIETKNGKVGIESICIEEDAARRIKTEKDHVIFRLDRLGIPLIEITTKPDIRSAEQAKEVAAYLGMVLKSTGKFKSGIGTIRQDLNVSIKGHPRVEVKGVQDLRLIPTAVDKEIERQLKNKKGNSEVRKMNPDGSTSYLRPMPGSARMYVETDHPLIYVDDKELKKIKLPELIVEKSLKLEKKYKLNANLAREIVDNKLFENFVKKYKNIEPNFIAKTLVEIPKEIKTRFKLDVGKIKEKDFGFVLENLDKKVISNSAVLEILTEVAKGNKVDISKYKVVDVRNLEAEIKKIINQKKDLSFNALMGIIMKKYRGKIDGKKVAELIKKNLK